MIVVILLLILADVGLLTVGLLHGSNAYLVTSIVASLLAAVVLILSSRRSGPHLVELDETAERAAEPAEPARRRGYRGRAGRRRRVAPPAAPVTGPGNPAVPRSSVTSPAVPGASAASPADRGSAAPAPTGPPGPEASAAGQAVATAGAPPGSAAGTPVTQPAAGAGERVDHGEQTAGAQGPAGPLQTAGAHQAAGALQTADAEETGYGAEEDPPDEPPAQELPPSDTARLAELTGEVLVVDGRPRYHLAGCIHLVGRDSEGLPVSEAVELGFTPCSLCEPATTLLAEPQRASAR